MTDRRRRLLALLWSRDDLLPGPKGQRFSKSKGVGPGTKRPCPDCGGTDSPGLRVDRFKRSVPCETCGGTITIATDGSEQLLVDIEPLKDGRWLADGARVDLPEWGVAGIISHNRGRGWVWVDDMDSAHEVVRTEAKDLPTRPARMVLCDGCGGSGVAGAHLRDLDDPGSEYRDPCLHCGGSGHRAVTASFDLALSAAEREGAEMEAQLERRRAQGSYAELEHALAELERPWRRLVVRCCVEAGQPRSVFESAELEAGLVMLEWLLPPSLRVPADVWVAWRRTEAGMRALAVGRGAGRAQLERRDKEIRRLDRQGRPRQWIAAEYRLSVDRVKRIVNGERDAA